MKGGFFAGLAVGALIGATILEAKPETLNMIKECKQNMAHKNKQQQEPQQQEPQS